MADEETVPPLVGQEPRTAPPFVAQVTQTAPPARPAEGPLQGRPGRTGVGAVERAVELAVLTAAAAIVPLLGWAYWAFVLRLPNNDFHDYWLAGRLVAQGRSPYDVAALEALARSEHLSFLAGGGYSYPPPFAVAMVPLAALPFPVALAAFNGLSIALFAVTVAAWIGRAHGWGRELRGRRMALALAAGVFPPVYGSVAMGQANLAVLPLLALGATLVLGPVSWTRGAAGGVLLGLAAIVKLVPAVVVAPLWLARRFGAAAGLVAAAVAAYGVAALVAPAAATGGGTLTALFAPDPFYSNQSLNGFVTRIVADSDRTSALWRGAFDPEGPMIALTLVFAAATLAVLWLARARLSSRRGLGLGLGFALVAGVIGAPKNSFWNEALVLVAAGLLLAVEAPELRFDGFDRLDRWLIGTWLGATFAWVALWAISPPQSLGSGPLAAAVEMAVTVLQSASLYGLLALWWLFARRLWRVPDAVAATPAPVTLQSAAAPSASASAAPPSASAFACASSFGSSGTIS